MGQVRQAAFSQGKGHVDAFLPLLGEGKAALFSQVLDGVERVAGVEGIGFCQVVQAADGGDQEQVESDKEVQDFPHGVILLERLGWKGRGAKWEPAYRDP